MTEAPNFGVEQRTPEEIAKIVEERIDWRLEGGRLVPAHSAVEDELLMRFFMYFAEATENKDAAP